MLKHLIFDLDGTLTDPFEGITRCVAYALARFDIHVADRRALSGYIGPPLKQSFSDFHGRCSRCQLRKRRESMERKQSQGPEM